MGDPEALAMFDSLIDANVGKGPRLPQNMGSEVPDSYAARKYGSLLSIDTPVQLYEISPGKYEYVPFSLLVANANLFPLIPMKHPDQYAPVWDCPFCEEQLARRDEIYAIAQRMAAWYDEAEQYWRVNMPYYKP